MSYAQNCNLSFLRLCTYVLLYCKNYWRSAELWLMYDLEVIFSDRNVRCKCDRSKLQSMSVRFLELLISVGVSS